MIFTPNCDCEEGKDPTKAAINIGYPDERRDEREAVIQCAHCGKILKYAGSVAYWDTKEHRYRYRT